MKRPTHPRLWTAAMAATIISAALVAAVPAYAISGGTATDTSAQPYLAKIDVGPGVSCSGALLAREWVVTSAACFAAVPSQPEAPAPGAPREATTATVGGTQIRQVDRIVPRDGRDLVLAHLDSPVTGITPVPLATTAPSQGQAMQVSGYGRTAGKWVPDHPYTGEFTVESIGSGTLHLQGATAGTSVCKGDAGGPVLRSGVSGPEIVAVASGSYQAGCLGETAEQTGATAARVDDLQDWMAAEVVALQATPASKHAINLSWTAMTTRYRVYGAPDRDRRHRSGESARRDHRKPVHPRLPARGANLVLPGRGARLSGERGRDLQYGTGGKPDRDRHRLQRRRPRRHNRLQRCHRHGRHLQRRTVRRSHAVEQHLHRQRSDATLRRLQR